MERLTTTSDKGGLAFTFNLDVTCSPSEMRKIVLIGLRLKEYEETGLSPDEIVALIENRAKPKEIFDCAHCKHIKPSDKTNRLFCTYHSEYDCQYETYPNDYCSYFERKLNRRKMGEQTGGD